MSLYTEQTMRAALRRYVRAVRPDLDDLRDLADGPYDEPFCTVCAVFLPVFNDRLPGWGAACDILNYHDEMMYGIGNDFDHEEDPVYGIGLSQVVTYQRCLKVYEAARELLRA